MMTIIIELFSFLFWARSVYGGSSIEPCKISTQNTNDYMHEDYRGVSEFTIVDAANLGCGEARFKWRQLNERDATSATMLNPISCDEIGENYVIDSIVYASLGYVAGSCGELEYPYDLPTDAKEVARYQEAHIWCNNQIPGDFEFICCFGDYKRFINIPQEIGEECIGESKCEIIVDASGLYINDVSYTFSENDNAILTRIKGPWALKVLFECAPAPVIEEGASGMEGTREYSEYKFVTDDSDFSEYLDVSVHITGYCKASTMHGGETTQNGAFNQCVYDSFVFKVYSENNYLGDTRPWKAKRNVLSCNEAYSVSLPVGSVDETGFRINTNQIHFTVTKSGGGSC